MVYSYLFEAKSIQSYIFATNRLKEIVGGSEQIEQLTGDDGLVCQTLTTLGSIETIELSRLGGAAFYAFSKIESDVSKLAALWPLVFQQYAPSLQFIHAQGEGDNDRKAFEDAKKRLATNRNLQRARLPQSGVYSFRSGRTGEPATHAVYLPGGNGIKSPIDEATSRKLAFVRKPNDGVEIAALPKRFCKTSTTKDWPVNLTPEAGQDERNFPFKGDERVIALVHADGNGFGQLLMNLSSAVYKDKIKDEEFVKLFRAVSESIKAATENAAQLAVKKILEPHQYAGLYPARPIVLGGDDLTIVVRADLAMPFTKCFLNAFEVESKAELNALKKTFNNLKTLLPDSLSACAGIVYAKASQPFSALHNLAEGLCKFAKDQAKPLVANTNNAAPSSLSFYRVTTTLLESYSEVLKKELTVGNTMLSLGCYTLDEHAPLPKLSQLLALQTYIEESSSAKGMLREVMSLVHQSMEQADRRYKRWRELLTRKAPTELKQFDELLQQLSNIQKIELSIEATQALPFEDVMTLCAVQNLQQKETHSNELHT